MPFIGGRRYDTFALLSSKLGHRATATARHSIIANVYIWSYKTCKSNVRSCEREEIRRSIYKFVVRISPAIYLAAAVELGNCANNDESSPVSSRNGLARLPSSIRGVVCLINFCDHVYFNLCVTFRLSLFPRWYWISYRFSFDPQPQPSASTPSLYSQNFFHTHAVFNFIYSSTLNGREIFSTWVHIYMNDVASMVALIYNDVSTRSY